MSLMPTPLFGAIQDGSLFWFEDGGLIVGYPSLVKDDYDVEGAERARQFFLRDYPEFGVKCKCTMCLAEASYKRGG